MHIGQEKLESFIQNCESEFPETKFSQIVEVDDEDYLISHYSSDPDHLCPGLATSRQSLPKNGPIAVKQFSIDTQMSYEVIDSKKPSPTEQGHHNPNFNIQAIPKTSEDDILVSDSQLNNLVIQEDKSQSSGEQIPVRKRPFAHHQRKISHIPTHNVRKSENFWSSSNVQLWESLNLKSQSQNIFFESQEKRLSQATQEKTALSNSLKPNDLSKEKSWITVHDRVTLAQIKQTANLYNKKFIGMKKENIKADKYSTMDANFGSLQRSDGFTGNMKPSLDASKMRSFNHREIRKLSALKGDGSRNSSVKVRNEAAQNVKSMTNSLVKQKHYMSEKHQDYISQMGSKMSRSIDKDVILRQRQKFA